MALDQQRGWHAVRQATPGRTRPWTARSVLEIFESFSDVIVLKNSKFVFLAITIGSIIGIGGAVWQSYSKDPVIGTYGSSIYATSDYRVTHSEAIVEARVLSISEPTWNADDGLFVHPTQVTNGAGVFLVHTVNIDVLTIIEDTIGLDQQVELTLLGVGKHHTQTVDGIQLSADSDYTHDLQVDDQIIVYLNRGPLGWTSSDSGKINVIRMVGATEAYYRFESDGLYHHLHEEDMFTSVSDFNQFLQVQRLESEE